MRGLLHCLAGAMACIAILRPASGAELPDGWLLTIQTADARPHAIDAAPPGKLLRYEISGGTISPPRELSGQADALAATISPDGRSIALLRMDHSIALLDADGQHVRELAKTSAARDIFWPAGDGGEWVYFLDADPHGRARLLRRVSTHSGQAATAAGLNMTVTSLSLARAANTGGGRLVAMPASVWPGVAGYELSHGHGDLFRRLLDPDGRWPALSIDGETIASANADGSSIGISDWNGRSRRRVAAPGAGQRFGPLRWAANSAQYVLANVGEPAEKDHMAVDRLDAYVISWPDGAVSGVTHNQPGVFDRGQDLFLNKGTDFGLGSFEGEAPFVVRMPGENFAQGWTWDWGDGADAAPGDGTHRYAQAGLYDVVATRAGEVRRGRVSVLDRAAPQVVESMVIDDRHALVHFDKAVVLAGEIKLASAGSIQSAMLDANGQMLTITMNAGAAWPAALDLSAVRDRSQEPQGLTDANVTVSEPPELAANASALWRWSGAEATNAVWDAACGEPAFCRVMRQGAARFSRFGAMICGEGSFLAASSADSALDGKARNALTLQLLFRPTPAAGDETPRPLLRLGGGSDLSIEQAGAELRLVVRNGADAAPAINAPLATISSGRDVHLQLVLDAGKWTAYVDGQPAAPIAGETQAFAVGPVLEFAPALADSAPAWSGVIEEAAVIGRASTHAEAAAAHAASQRRLAQRPAAAARIDVEAKLLAATSVPRPAAIAPYRDALIANEYEITRHISGKPLQGRIRVAHFGLLNALPTGAARQRVGETYRLSIEPFADRTDLANTFLADTLPPDFDQTLYVDSE